MWEVVVKEYEKRNRTIIDAITNMRLVNMHQLFYDGESFKLELWKPPIS